MRSAKHTCSHSVFDHIDIYQSNLSGAVIRMTVVEVDSEFDVKLTRLILSIAK